MVYSTHMIIADEIFKTIDVRIKPILRKKSFKYGNVKPDISRLASHIPHTIKDSYLYVICEIEQLIEDTNNVEQMGSKEFAQKLGIINHYLADYFCLAHNKNIMNRGIVKHLIYEMKMNRIFKKNKKMNKNYLSSINDFTNFNSNAIARYILQMHKEYLKEKRSLNMDILYAMQACITVTGIIINICVEKCDFSAA